MRSSVIFLILIAAAPALATYDWHFVELSTTAYDYTSTSVWNGTAAWVDQAAGGYNIFYWDGETIQNVTMNSEYEWSLFPSLYDGTIAYQHYDIRESVYPEIFYWDGTQHIQVTDNDEEDTCPSLWDGQIAFQRGRYNECEIYLWDGQQEQRITHNSYGDVSPSLSQGTIVWCIYEDSCWDVAFWDGTAVYNVTDDPAEEYSPSNWLGNIVYTGGIGNRRDLFLGDGSGAQAITDTPDFNEEYPSTFQDYVVFHAYDGEDGEIYLWHNGEVCQLTDNDVDDVFPDIYVSDDQIQIVWHQQYGKVMYAWAEIIPEPSGVLIAIVGIAACLISARRRS